jgi:DNA-binding response OmpR family regulator
VQLLRILIVEDEWLIAQDHARALSLAGHTIVGPVAMSEAAIALIETQPVDVALLDFHLGAETSVALADRLRLSGIPYAVVTGHARRDLPNEFARATIIQKPVDPGELVAIVAKLTTGSE